MKDLIYEFSFNLEYEKILFFAKLIKKHNIYMIYWKDENNKDKLGSCYYSVNEVTTNLEKHWKLNKIYSYL